jgi:hypothetical protein
MKLEATRVRSEAVCPVCKGAVAAHHTTIKVQGMTFHAYCAGYKRRAASGVALRRLGPRPFAGHRRGTPPDV